MMSETVITEAITEIRNNPQGGIAKCGIYPVVSAVKSGSVLTTTELLRRLRERGIKNADVARAIKVSPSRVTEMFEGTRAIKLDEAARLVEAFDLESGQAPRKVTPLPASISRLIVLYVAAELGVDLQRNQGLVRELSEDVRAFAEYVADPSVRENTDAAEAFFQAMRLRRPRPEDTDPLETDPPSAQ